MNCEVCMKYNACGKRVHAVTDLKFKARNCLLTFSPCWAEFRINVHNFKENYFCRDGCLQNLILILGKLSLLHQTYVNSSLIQISN